MTKSLTIVSILFSLFIIVFILILLRKQKINIKYSLIWIILFFLLFIATIAPGFLSFVTHITGFKSSSNMILSLIIAVLIIITIALTIIVSQHDKKIRLLIQELSLQKGKQEGKNE